MTMAIRTGNLWREVLAKRSLANIIENFTGIVEDRDYTDLSAFYKTNKAFKPWLQERLFAAARQSRGSGAGESASV